MKGPRESRCPFDGMARNSTNNQRRAFPHGADPGKSANLPTGLSTPSTLQGTNAFAIQGLPWVTPCIFVSVVIVTSERSRSKFSA